MTAKEQFKILIERAVEVIPEDEFLAKIEKSIATKKPLKVKLGCDPSRPDLHIGHAVVLHKLREFQDLGHEAILVVGDFTAMIGDPSGTNSTRPQLTFEQTRENGLTYFEQAAKILDTAKTRIVYNSEWLGKMSFAEVIRLSASYTVARILERDDFSKRFASEQPISVHEFLYPLAQAMDSVALKADVELGGTDQKFNLLVGRDVQREYGIEPQVIMTMPLIEGTDGERKMSKSYDNYVGLTQAPVEMFGRLMSVPDSMIVKYYQLAAFADSALLEEVRRKLDSGEINPMDLKKDMAVRVISLYHPREAAISAREEFERVFSKGEEPEDMPTAKYNAGTKIWIVEILRENGLVKTGGEARRLITQGAVSIDGEKIDDDKLEISIDKRIVIKVGKRRFLEVIPR
ncbi:MAG TPA: tyrosine--tRNA ligase [candidate division Zixibacteria bacterium]|nr:tyrosine--tRNA ligase [candidate division Zixibacteria bacterium]